MPQPLTPPANTPLVDIHWLHVHLNHPQLRLLDASMAPPGQPRYQPGVMIPGAQRFDFDGDICDRTSPLPHMLPNPANFTQSVQALGIAPDSWVVVYDHLGLFASPRAWWMFQAMGHRQVLVLDGGLPAWRAAGFALTNTYAPQAVGSFQAELQPHRRVDRQQVLTAIDQGSARILDARPAGRFLGQDPEPRPGLLRGHMPGAQNLPYSQVLNQGTMLNPESLKALFAPLEDGQKPWIFSCGSGVTACILALAAQVAGYKDAAVYDGSWSEWGQPELNLPRSI
jgi:thiosulfate/3-mercaptopyruvate sulfurtransferase